MAENVIFEDQTLDGFAAPGEGVPFFLYMQEGQLFSFVLGETYIVNWDGVEYSVIGKEVTEGGVTLVCIGNESFITGGNDTDEPFLIYAIEDTSYIATDDTTTDTHTVSIYQTVEDEPQEEVGIVIKNYSGVPIEYKGVEKVMFNTADGGRRVYSRGDALEDVSIELDFSSGDQIVKAAEGTLVKSAVIKKPDTLVAENIAEGIDIAGIIGTLAPGGSGGGKLVVKTGEFTPTTYSHTVTHWLGTVPIFARLMPTTGFPSETNVNVLYFVDGISTELANMAGMTERLQYGAYMNSYRKQLSQFASSYGIDYASTSLAIANANANAITFGSASYRLTTARTWSWLVVGFETTE